MAVWRRSSSALATASASTVINKNKFAERLAEQRSHNAIGFGKCFGHNRFSRRAAAGACSRTANPGLYTETPLWARVRDRGKCLAHAGLSRPPLGWLPAPSAHWPTYPPVRQRRHSRWPGVQARVSRIRLVGPAAGVRPASSVLLYRARALGSPASEAAPITSAPRKGGLSGE